jgi:hypothetical protein
MSIVSLSHANCKVHTERKLNVSADVFSIDYGLKDPHAYIAWRDVPDGIKTRRQLLKELRRPVPKAKLHGSIVLLHDKPVGTKRGVVPFSSAEIAAIRSCLSIGGSLTAEEVGRLRAAGQFSQPYLFEKDQTEQITKLTEDEARDLFDAFLFDGSHEDDYIVDLPQRGRRTWRKKFSAPSMPKHLCGQPTCGTKKGDKARLVTVDLDRHRGTVKAEEHLNLCLKVGKVLSEQFGDMRFAPEINLKNGSVKFFGWNDGWYGSEEAERVGELVRETLQQAIPDHDFSRVEIFPSSCPQVLAPLRRDKIMVIDQPIRQVRSWCQKWVCGRKVRKYCKVWSVADYMNWVVFRDTPFDLAGFEEILKNAVANLPDSEGDSGKPSPKRKTAKKAPRKAESSGMGSIGSLKGRCAQTLVGFWSGREVPPADTLNIFLGVTLRIFKFEGMTEDDAVDWIEDRLQLLPDTSFSNRLTDDFEEAMRVVRATASKIWACNGYQPDPDTSNAKLQATVDRWRDRNFMLSDPETWENAEKRTKVKFRVSYPIHHLVPLAEILGVDVEKAREFLDMLLIHVDTENELALSFVGILMKKAGIKGSKNQQKRHDVRKFLKNTGLLILQHRYFCDHETGYRHGDFFICSAEVEFAEAGQLKAVGAAEGTPHTPVSICYLSVSDDICWLDDDSINELIMEGRRLACEARYWRMRRRRKDEVLHAAA